MLHKKFPDGNGSQDYLSTKVLGTQCKHKEQRLEEHWLLRRQKLLLSRKQNGDWDWTLNQPLCLLQIKATFLQLISSNHQNLLHPHHVQIPYLLCFSIERGCRTHPSAFCYFKKALCPSCYIYTQAAIRALDIMQKLLGLAYHSHYFLKWIIVEENWTSRRFSLVG